MSANDLQTTSETDWHRVDHLTEDQIDTSDIAPLDEAFFADAKLRLPEGKVSVLLSVDSDVFDWFKAQGPEYQLLINTALRNYAEKHNDR